MTPASRPPGHAAADPDGRTADPAVLEALRTALPAGWRLDAHAVVDSTNDLARRAAEDGAPEGLVVWGGEQRQGRGRLGRRWASPPGNLYVSIVLRPTVEARRLSEVTFVAALALADALATVPGLPQAALKWPNDVLLDGAKIAGILLEGALGRDNRPAWLVLGTGVNIAHRPESSDYPTAALADLATPVPAAPDFLARYAGAVAARYRHWLAHGFEPVRRDWMAAAAHIGRPVRINLPEGPVEGVFESLDPEGHLVLDQGGGRRRVLSSGDVLPPVV
jgi:BirA family biotin operon repressor/biotin-[acetyl-CoA-carboxylase] ligase